MFPMGWLWTCFHSPYTGQLPKDPDALHRTNAGSLSAVQFGIEGIGLSILPTVAADNIANRPVTSFELVQ